MEFQRINETCSYFHGPVNIGYIQQKDEGMLIDAGIDKATMKKVIKQLKQQELPLTHLFITHAHSDHFGGAYYLQQQQDVYTIAPVLEEAIMRYPVLEPLYLFGGNDPLPELRNKFLEGNPIRIDQVIDEGNHHIDRFTFDAFTLPGHSYNQLAIRVHEVLFAGDSYFSSKQLNKHKIPFLTDANLAIESLMKLKTIPCDGAVPGHGVYETNFHTTVDENIAYHLDLLQWLEGQIVSREEMTHETIIADMCQAFQVNTPQLSQWLLFRTAITSYLVALIKQKKITYKIESGRWVFFSR